MRFLCFYLAIWVASPALATLRLQELNRIGLTGKISDRLVSIGQGYLSLPIISSLLVREDSILLGGDEQRRIAGRLSVALDYKTMKTFSSGAAVGDGLSRLRAEIDILMSSPSNSAALARVFDLVGKLDQVSSSHRLNSIFLTKTAYAVYERTNGGLYLLMVNVVNDYLSVVNIVENLLIDFDHTMTTSGNVDEFIKKRALERRGVYLAIAEINNNRADIYHVGMQIDEHFWSNVYPTVVSNNKIKPLVESARFSYRAAAGNNFMVMRRHNVELQEGDSLLLFTGVNDFESSEVMLSAPRALDKHVAENVNKLNYYLGEDNSSLGQIDHDDLLKIVSNGYRWWQDGNTEELLSHLDSVNYTLLYYLHHPQTP